MTQLQNENSRKMHLLEQEIKRAVTEQAQDEKEAQTKNQKMITKTEAIANKQIIDVNGEKAINVKKVQAETVQIANKAQADAKALLIDTGKTAKVMGIEVTAELENVKAKYATLSAECEAE